MRHPPSKLLSKAAEHSALDFIVQLFRLIYVGIAGVSFGCSRVAPRVAVDTAAFDVTFGTMCSYRIARIAC